MARGKEQSKQSSSFPRPSTAAKLAAVVDPAWRRVLLRIAQPRFNLQADMQ